MMLKSIRGIKRREALYSFEWTASLVQSCLNILQYNRTSGNILLKNASLKEYSTFGKKELKNSAKIICESKPSKSIN
jgi:hypothetical protein